MFTSTKISDGDVLNGASLEHGDKLTVTKGGSAYNVTVGYKADLEVFNNGVVSGVRIQEGGDMEIKNASAYSVNVSDDGNFIIESAFVNGLSLANGGNATISNGAVVRSLNASTSAYIGLVSGGIISGGTMGGELKAAAGGIMIATVAAGARINGFDITGSYSVASGGVVIANANVSKYGSGEVLSGQALQNVKIEYKGNAHVRYGAAASGAVVSSGGNIHIYSGATGENLRVVGADGKAIIYSGASGAVLAASSGGIIDAAGKVDGIAATSGAKVIIRRTADADKLVIASGAVFTAEQGAEIDGFKVTATQTSTEGMVLSNAVVNKSATVSSGGKVVSALVSSGATMTIAKGGTAVGAINNGGLVEVVNSGVASGAVINAGNMVISSGGEAVGGKINANGTLTVLSKGKATSAYIAGGKAVISSGSIIEELRAAAGTVQQKKNAVINGISADEDITHVNGLNYSSATVKANAKAYLNSGDKASGVKVNNAGTLDLRAGAAATATVVSGGGKVNVFGTATGTVIKQNGNVTVSSGGVARANDIAVGGNLTAVSGGVVADTTISNGAKITVSSGGRTDNIKVTSGSVNAYAGGTAGNVTVSGKGTVYIYDKGLMLGGKIEDNAKVTVSKGGTAQAVNVNSGALYIDGGAKGVGNIINRDGNLVVRDGAVDENSIINAGYAVVLAGGTISNTTVKLHGEVDVQDGGIVKSINFESGAVINGLTAKSKHSANKFLITGAVVSCHETANLYSNQSAAQVVVQSSAILNIYNGGVAENVNVSAGEIRASAGTVNGAEINNNAMILARSGAVVNDVQVHDGDMFIYDATASGTVVKSFGELYVNNGGTVNDTTVNNGNVTLTKGAAADGITIKGGKVTAAGKVNSVNLVAGSFTAENGALVQNSVITGGSYILSGNAVHSGTINIAAGNSMIATAGTTIDFGVAGRSANDGYIINNISLVNGAPTYTITVDNFENAGIYKLAQGAQSFNKTVSVKNASGSSVVTLTTNGGNVYYDGMLYELKQSSGNLTLKVSEQERSSISGNKVSQIIAWDANRGAVGMVATSPDAPAQWKGIWDWSGCCGTGSVCCTDKWAVAGTGRFKGTALDTDGILLYNKQNNTFAVWSNIADPSYGYISLCHVEANFSVKAVGNFNNNEFDDIIICDEKGSFGVVLDGVTYRDIWHVDNPASNNIELVGAGYFGNANGTESLVIKNKADNTYCIWNNSDITFNKWSWSQAADAAGAVMADWEIAAIGDFQGDGIDDIIVMNNKNGQMFAWENGKSSDQRWVGQVEAGNWEVAAVGDYNGDGKEDILLRELISGWGGLGYWGAANADNWVDLNARVENNEISNFAVIA